MREVRCIRTRQQKAGAYERKKRRDADKIKAEASDSQSSSIHKRPSVWTRKRLLALVLVSG